MPKTYNEKLKIGKLCHLVVKGHEKS